MTANAATVKGTATSLRDRYFEEGYVAPIRVLSTEDALHYRACLEAAERKRGGPLAREERGKPHLLFRWAAELVRHPAVLALVEPIVGPNILLWESTLFTKEAGGSEVVTWHQDLRYWGLEPDDQVVTAWIALSPSTRESGCMRVVPGSHLSDVAPHTETYAQHNLLGRGQEIQVEVNEADVVNFVLQPGEMSLHHVRIIHGSEPNRSSDRRIGFAARYMPTSVRQKGAMRDTAYLVKGVDHYHHFDMEPQEPAEDYSPEARAIHEELRRRRRTLLASQPKGDTIIPRLAP